MYFALFFNVYLCQLNEILIIRFKTMKKVETINKENFNEVYNAFYGSLFAFVNNKVHDTDYSNAIVNDSFLKAYNSMDSFKPSLSGLNTWLHNIAKNRMIDHFRGVNRDKRSAEETNVNNIEFSLNGSFLNGETQMINKEIEFSIEKSFAKIKNDAHREIAKNFLIDGFSLKEIAENFDIPVNSVKTIVKRVRETLQTELKPVKA